MRKIFVLFILLLALTLISCDMEIKEQTSEVYINVKDAESKTIEVPETQTKATTYLLKTEALFVSPNIIGEMDFQSIPEKLTLTQGFWRFTIQGLNANGDLVSTGMIEKVIREGVNEITISLDSPTYEEIEYGYVDFELYTSETFLGDWDSISICSLNRPSYEYNTISTSPSSIFYNQYLITKMYSSSVSTHPFGSSNIDYVRYRKIEQKQVRVPTGEYVFNIIASNKNQIIALATAQVSILKNQTTFVTGHLIPLKEIELNFQIIAPPTFTKEETNEIKNNNEDIPNDAIIVSLGDQIDFSYLSQNAETIYQIIENGRSINTYSSNSNIFSYQVKNIGLTILDFLIRVPSGYTNGSSRSRNTYLYVKKSIKIYSILNHEMNFDANGGVFYTGETTNQAKNFNTIPIREGYEFYGWSYYVPDSIYTTFSLYTDIDDYSLESTQQCLQYIIKDNKLNKLLNPDGIFKAQWTYKEKRNIYIDGELVTSSMPSPDTIIYYTQPNGQGEFYTSENLPEGNEDLYLYRCLDYPKITITYKLGEGLEDIIEERIPGMLYYKMPIVQKPGYEFVKWQTDEYSPKEVTQDSIIPYNNHNLIAVWIEQKTERITVSFNLNTKHNLKYWDSSASAYKIYSLPSQEFEFGKMYNNLPYYIGQAHPLQNEIFPTNVFEGWFLDAKCTIPITENTVVSLKQDHILYAKWSNMPEKQIEINYSNICLNLSQNTNYYYYYYSQSTLSQNQVFENTPIKQYADFNSNATIKDIGGFPEIQEVEGYDFVGWISDDYFKYNNNGDYENLTSFWRKEDYEKILISENTIITNPKISYLNYGGLETYSKTYYALYIQNLESLNLIKIRLHCDEILNNPLYKASLTNKAYSINGLNERIFENNYLNCYVQKGKSLEQAIIINSSGYTPSTCPYEQYHLKNICLSVEKLFKKSNYSSEFFNDLECIKIQNESCFQITNWATTADLTNLIDLSIPITENTDIDLYPIIGPKNSITVNYYSSKEAIGVEEPLIQEIYKSGDKFINHLELIPTYIEKNNIPYVFSKWSIYDEDYIFLISYSDTRNIYPEYQSPKDTKIIIFDSQNGELLSEQSAFTNENNVYLGDYDRLMNVSFSRFFKYGYYYTGIYYDQECTQKMSTNDIFPRDKDKITLYAGWEPKSFDVKFIGLTQTKQVTFGETYGSLPTPTKTGYKFLGWYFQGEKITSNTIVTQADEHQLEPRWEKLEINCTFQLESEVLETKTYSYNETFGALPTSTIDGKEIVWFLEGHPITPDMIVSDLRTEDFTLNGVIGNKVIKMSNKDVVRYMDDDAIIEAMSNIIDPNDKKFHTCINNYLEISYFFPRLKASEQITYYSSNIAGTHVIEVNPRYFDYQIIYPYDNDYYANKDIIITLITENNKEYTFSYSKATESSIKTMQKDSKIEWLEDGEYYPSSIYASSIRKIIFEIPESPYYEGFYQPFEIKMNSNFSASYGYRPAGLYDSEFNNIEFTLREENEIGTIVIDNEERAIPFIQKAWASEPYLRTYAEIDNQDFATGKLASGEQGSGVGYARIEAYGKEFEGRLYNCEWDENGIRGTISYPYYIDKYTNEVFDNFSGYLDFDIAWDDESKYYETNHFDIKELEIRY